MPNSKSLTAAAPLNAQRHPGGVHLALAAQTELRLVELLAHLDEEPGDDVPSAMARHVHLQRSTNHYATVSHLKDIRVYHVNPLTDDNGGPIDTPHVGPKDRLCVLFNAQSGRWEVCLPRPLVRFELDEEITPGGSAFATEVIWNGSDYVAEGQPMVVFDAIGMFHSDSPCRGIAGWWCDSERWEIIQLDPSCVSSSSSSVCHSSSSSSSYSS